MKVKLEFSIEYPSPFHDTFRIIGQTNGVTLVKSAIHKADAINIFTFEGATYIAGGKSQNILPPGQLFQLVKPAPLSVDSKNENLLKAVKWEETRW